MNTHTNTHANLRSCEYHRLSKVLQHEGQCRGSVCHGVCPMQDNEGIVDLIVLADVGSNPCPVLHGHIARVQQRKVFKDAIDYAVLVHREAKCQEKRQMLLVAQSF